MDTQPRQAPTPPPAPATTAPALGTPPRPPTAPGPPSERTWMRWGMGRGGGVNLTQTDHLIAWPLNWLWDGDTSCLSQDSLHQQYPQFSSSGQTHSGAEGSLPWTCQAPGRHQPAEGERVPAPPADILQQPGRDLQCRVQPDHLQLLDWDQHQENIPNCPSIDFLAPWALPNFSPKFCYFLMNRHQSNSLSLSWDFSSSDLSWFVTCDLNKCISKLDTWQDIRQYTVLSLSLQYYILQISSYYIRCKNISNIAFLVLIPLYLCCFWIREVNGFGTVCFSIEEIVGVGVW